MKYALITGTRPQIIKSAPLLNAAKQFPSLSIDHIFTGQHYDSYLTDVFFKALKMGQPDYKLNIGSGTTDYHVRTIIERLSLVLSKMELDGIIVPGDTNSAIGAALTGMFLSIPVVHLESGLRSYDLLMKEEVNRRLIDHGSSVLLAPTDIAVKNLRDESVQGKIVLSGDTMYDLLKSELSMIRNNDLFTETANEWQIEKNMYQVMTLHRRENLNDPERVKRIFDSINKNRNTTILPLHPHTLKIIKNLQVDIPSNIKIVSPLSYHKFLNLVAFSNLIITDSGGLQKEAYLLDVPCVTLRDSTEWLETVNYGANKVVGTNSHLIENAMKEMYGKKLKTDKSVYGSGNSSNLILKELTSHKPQIPTITKL